MKERVYQGVGVSSGVAIGPVYLFTKKKVPISERDISEEEVPRELERFRKALARSKQELLAIRQRISSELGNEQAKIFDVQIDICGDAALIEDVEERVRRKRKNVEYVFHEVLTRYLHIIAGFEDEVLMERHTDIRDFMDRVMAHLMETRRKDFSEIDFAAVVVARDIAPSDTAAMDKSKILGFVTDIGGRTSHTAIMAQSLGIPAVVGLHNVSDVVESENQVIVDGNRGILIVNPSEETRQRYDQEMFRIKAFEDKLLELKDLPAVTTDGHQVVLSANIEFPEELYSVIAHGAQGVGLYRTEFLFMNREDLPSEEEQFQAYKQILEGIKPHPVIIRTFDLGGDKFVSHLDIPFEMNPFLGWRAIRFCLERLDIFKVQLRAILRAGVYGDMKLMYPMVSSVDEVVRANAVVDEVKEELLREGVPFAESFEIGAMIEIPSAALTAEIIAKEVDFFSIGTNDLIQYTLAVERTNDKIAHLYKPCHPGVLRLVRKTIDDGHNNGIWVGMCGEMAAEAPMSLILLGMGLDEISVSPAFVPKIKKVIRSLSYKEAEEFAKEAMHYQSAEDIKEKAYERLREVIPEMLESE